MQVLDRVRAPEKLDANEAHYRVPSDRPGLRLFLRHLPPRGTQSGAAEVVLYVHGGTFPSALSIAHRFDGRSWRDELCAHGFDVWGLDFLGFGLSDPYPEMAEPAERNMRCWGRPTDACRQLERAVHWIRLASRRAGCVDHRAFLGARSRRDDLPGCARSWWSGWCSSARSPGARRRARRSGFRRGDSFLCRISRTRFTDDRWQARHWCWRGVTSTNGARCISTPMRKAARARLPA